MYFWKTVQLADDIKNNKISEKSKMYYYLLMMVIFNIFAYSFLLDLGAENVSVDIFEMAITTLLLVGGILINFKANKGVDGADYMARVIMLGVPITVKLTITMMLFGILLFEVVYAYWDFDVLTDWFILGQSVVATILFYWRVNVHLKYINQPE